MTGGGSLLLGGAGRWLWGVGLGLLCLSIVIGSSSLLQLVPDEVFLQLLPIADHKLLCKILQGQRRAQSFREGGGGRSRVAQATQQEALAPQTFTAECSEIMPTEPVPEARSDGQGCHVLWAMAGPKHDSWTVFSWLYYLGQVPLNCNSTSSAVQTHQGGCEVGKAGRELVKV